MTHDIGQTDFDLSGNPVTPGLEDNDSSTDVKEQVDEAFKEAVSDFADALKGKVDDEDKDDDSEEEESDEEEDASSDESEEKDDEDKPQDDTDAFEEVDEVLKATPSQEAIDVLSTQVTRLRDLNYTIGLEGVSSHDMAALSDIRHKVSQYGVEISPTPSLEHYNGLFMDERSSLNLAVAQEGFASTMIDTIKGWLKQLVQFLANMASWVVKQFIGDTPAQRKLDNLSKKLTSVKKARIEAQQYVKLPKTMEDRLYKHANDLITDDRLPNDRLMVAAFVGGKDASEVESLTKDAVNAVKALATELDNLRSDLEGGSTNVKVNDNQILQLGIISSLFDEFTRPLTYASQPSNKVTLDVFKEIIPMTTLTHTAYSPLVEHYRILHGKLKGIRKVERPDGLGTLVSTLNNIQVAISNLGMICNVLKRYHGDKTNVLRAHLSYENAHFSLLFKYAMDNGDKVVSDNVNKVFSKAKDDLSGATV